MTKNKSKPVVMMGAAMLIVGLAQAQESVNASGGDATGTGGNTAYSVGQVAYTSNIGTNGTVYQGVQHAYEIFTVGINETTLDISFSVIPNPTTENLTLQVSDYNNENLQYQVYNMQGKLLNIGQVTANQTRINMGDLPAATYFLYVTRNNKKIQTFKIIKN